MTKAETEGVREMVATYITFDDLCRQGRDSVWTYVARNLSRPLAIVLRRRVGQRGGRQSAMGGLPAHERGSAKTLSRAGHRRAGLCGRQVRDAKRPRRLVHSARGVSVSSLGRTHRVRTAASGATRGQFEKFRKGSFTGARIAWDEAWTMDEDVQPLFPCRRASIFGRRRATAKALPDKVTAYSGQLPMRDASEAVADACLTVLEDAPRPAEGRFTGGSALSQVISSGRDTRAAHVVFSGAAKPGAPRR